MSSNSPNDAKFGTANFIAVKKRSAFCRAQKFPPELQRCSFYIKMVGFVLLISMSLFSSVPTKNLRHRGPVKNVPVGFLNDLLPANDHLLLATFVRRSLTSLP